MEIKTTQIGTYRGHYSVFYNKGQPPSAGLGKESNAGRGVRRSVRGKRESFR